jgi:hypothetical protein
MANQAMNVRGPCASCGAQLASDQRYCVECGHRVGPPLALPYALPAAATEPPTDTGGRLLRLPIPPEMAGVFAALALGFGVVLGTAISPNLAGIIAAPSAPVVVEAPPETPSTGPSGGGGGSPAPAAATAPAAVVASTSPSGSSGGGGGGGGGGHKKKKKKQKPAPITFSGTVVRVNPVAQSYTVSSSGGLIAIHADTLPKVGDQVESQVRKLNNGTYAENGGRNPVGSADVASFQGTVTYCADLEHPATPCSNIPTPDDHFVYAVSGLGASVLVSSPQGAALPPVGSQVQVGVHIGSTFAPIDPESSDDWTDYPDPCNPVSTEQSGVPTAPTAATDLAQTSLTVNPLRQSAVFQAVVQETNCPAGLVLSADDVREAGRDLPALGVPAGIDQARLARGQAVQVAADIGSDGKLTLTGITSDQGAAGADDASQGQGTLTGS